MLKKIKYGFTLVELLVVMSIIALMLAVLMPSLSKARERAKQVVCVSNLKQWHLYVGFYLNENRNFYWNGWLANRPDLSVPFEVAMKPIVKSYDIYFCPSAKKKMRDGSRPGPQTAWWDYTRKTGVPGSDGSYGVNLWVQNIPVAAKVDGWLSGNSWKNITAIKSPKEVPLMADAWRAGDYPFPTNIIPEYDGDMQWGMAPFCTNRHQGRVNVMFVDGSARKVRLKDLWALLWSKQFRGLDSVPLDFEWPDWLNKLNGNLSQE